MLNINTEVIQLNQRHPLICSAGRIRKKKEITNYSADWSVISRSGGFRNKVS